SDVSYLSQSDLLSYLLIGEPGFDLLGQAANRSAGAQGENLLITSLLSPIVTSFATERLRQTVLGRWVDQIRLEASNPDAAATTPGQGTLQTYLFNTRLAGDKELLKD